MTNEQMQQAAEAACKLIASGEMAYFEAITSQFAPLCNHVGVATNLIENLRSMAARWEREGGLCERDDCLAAIAEIERLRHFAPLCDDAKDAEIARLTAEVARLREFEPMLLGDSTPTDMKIKVARGVMENLVLAFDALNGDANYSETECKTKNGKKYYVTVRRGDRPTDHQLRKQAESERDAAIDRLNTEGRRLSDELDAAVKRVAAVEDVVERAKVRSLRPQEPCECEDYYMVRRAEAKYIYAALDAAKEAT